jgi:hypothetical protein
VILFTKVVQILTLPDSDGSFFWFVGIKYGQRCRIGTTFIDSDHLGHIVVSNGFAEKSKSCRCISFCRQQKVDSLTCGIDYPAQVFPLHFDFDVGFIHSPPPAHSSFMPTKDLI